MTTDTSVAENLRTCEHCFQAKPITEFRCTKRGTDRRARECRACHNEAERLRQAAKREQEIDRKLAQFSAAVKRTRDMERVAFLVAVMVDYFGGLHEFVAAWMWHVDQATAKSPGSKRVMDFFEAMTQMIAAASEYRRPPDPAEMSTEDLTVAMHQLAREVIEETPEIAVLAAQEIGWEVTPPSDVEMP